MAASRHIGTFIPPPKASSICIIPTWAGWSKRLGRGILKPAQVLGAAIRPDQGRKPVQRYRSYALPSLIRSYALRRRFERWR